MTDYVEKLMSVEEYEAWINVHRPPIYYGASVRPDGVRVWVYARDAHLLAGPEASF